DELGRVLLPRPLYELSSFLHYPLLVSFRGAEALFFRVNPAARTARPSVRTLTAIAGCSSFQSCWSCSRVLSEWASTSSPRARSARASSLTGTPPVAGLAATDPF